MKKLIAILLLLINFMGLTAIEAVSGEHRYQIDDSESDLSKLKKVITHKEKDGLDIEHVWHGISLECIKRDFKLGNDYTLVFISDDNYLARLTSEDINKYDPLLAFFMDGEKLEDNNRLIIPEMPSMYWVRNIKQIKVEDSPEFLRPDIVFLAEPVLTTIELTEEPEPFQKVSGYFFPQLLTEFFPELSGLYLLIGKDGITHQLEYEDYLSKAVLVKTDSGYILQSPQMPGGMWLKNIAYIQKDRTAIIFRSQFEKISEITSLANWKSEPLKVVIHYTGGIKQTVPVTIDFSQPEWDSALKFSWQ
ncbi:MAG: molybdopterin-dependent oxidoreductase [Candidatus Cloacimonetes bacterium]|nr:molybdopterin-dependent oxidoreductase [Candidatus Cloacimonadota bacterium]